MLTRLVDRFQQLLGELVFPLEPEDDHAEVPLGRNLEDLVGVDKLLELLCQLDVLPDVVLEALHAVVAEDEPELEGSKPLAQGNLPMLGTLRGRVLFSASSLEKRLN